MAKQALPVSEELRPILAEVVDRIVQIADPEAIVLFGSHAEGHARPGSDVDLLVIADARTVGVLTEALCEAVAELARGRWHEVPSLDLLVLTPAQWRRESQLPGQLAHRARRRGVTVYGQAA